VLREVTTDTQVLERLVSPAGKDVLDVGCGRGALVRELCERGARAIGIEISDAQLAAARERDPDGAARYLVGRAESLPIDDGSVDIVLFMRSLHHVAVDRMPAALKEARRVLRPDGSVYVAEPVPEGEFFELTRLVDDELAVLRAAQQAVSAADDDAFRRVTTLEYAVAGSFADVAAYRALVVSVDPGRARIFDEREPEIAAAFERLGEPGAVPGERRFHHPMRVDVLGPATAALPERLS
jgi:ubiquinone/menaquinone biosynthesis C-methylase UbiE